MSETTDAAHRLHSILRKAKKCESGLKVRSVWAIAFGIKDEKIEPVYRSLVLAIQELDEIEGQLQSGDEDTKLYLRHFSALRAILTPANFDLGWHETQNKLTEQALESLEYCSAYLQKHCPEKQVPEDEIGKLNAQIQELVEDIAKSTLPELSKRILSDIARSLLDALHEQPIRGVNGMMEELYIIRARMDRNWVGIMKESSDPLFQRLLGVVKNWHAVTSAYLNTAQLASAYFPALMDVIQK